MSDPVTKRSRTIKRSRGPPFPSAIVQLIACAASPLGMHDACIAAGLIGVPETCRAVSELTAECEYACVTNSFLHMTNRYGRTPTSDVRRTPEVWAALHLYPAAKNVVFLNDDRASHSGRLFQYDLAAHVFGHSFRPSPKLENVIVVVLPKPTENANVRVNLNAVSKSVAHDRRKMKAVQTDANGLIVRALTMLHPLLAELLTFGLDPLETVKVDTEFECRMNSGEPRITYFRGVEGTGFGIALRCPNGFAYENKRWEFTRTSSYDALFERDRE